MKNKQRAIYLDQRIAEEFCNFRCEYCEGFYPTEYSLLKDKEGNLHVPEEWYKLIKRCPKTVQENFETGRSFKHFYDMAEKIIKKNKKTIDIDILKISGGEVSIYQGLCDFVENIHNDFTMIQILSNGSNISKEDMLRYKNMGNITFQISLDGVTKESNYGKSHSSVITERVVKNVEELLNNGMGVEINCVLTKHNTDKFDLFLEHFKDYKNLMIVPRPVRGEPRTILAASPEQVEVMEKYIYENYNKYKNIIPPIQYFDNLFAIMKTGKRPTNCYIPYFVQSVDGYGNFELCPIGLLYKEHNNIFDEQFISNELLLNSCYNNDNNKKCDDCINQYEMFNLFVDDKIGTDELRKLPSLNNDRVISHIEDIKVKIKEKYGRNN